jgi:hypothetical protein
LVSSSTATHAAAGRVDEDVALPVTLLLAEPVAEAAERAEAAPLAEGVGEPLPHALALGLAVVELVALPVPLLLVLPAAMAETVGGEEAVPLPVALPPLGVAVPLPDLGAGGVAVEEPEADTASVPHAEPEAVAEVHLEAIALGEPLPAALALEVAVPEPEAVAAPLTQA